MKIRISAGEGRVVDEEGKVVWQRPDVGGCVWNGGSVHGSDEFSFSLENVKSWWVEKKRVYGLWELRAEV